jgi:two-component system CheB/CheR fusion protein
MVSDDGLDKLNGGEARDGDGDALIADGDLAGFEALLDYLHRSRGFDFTGYKRTTLSRRIHRRMQTVGAATYGDYIDYLEVRPDEFPLLFNTILINVTAFFRDSAAWGVVQRLVESRLTSLDAGAPLRVWCAGCASGEEAYTLAILLAEMVGPASYAERVKIYATDIDEEALAQARLATYSDRAVEGIPDVLRDKYFTKIGVGYMLNKDIRRGVIFGRHDLVQDAPISRVDLLACRNTLMYFNAEAQTRILRRLHFALNDDGILFLGKAEMLLTHAHLFTPIDLKLRIFERTKGRVRERLLAQDPANAANDVSDDDRGRLHRAAFDRSPTAQIVLDNEGKVALVNNRAAQLFGLTAEDLSRPFHDLEVSYRPAELRSSLDRVRKERRPIHLREVERTLDSGERTYLDIEMIPLLGEGGAVIGTQLSFEDITAAHRLQGELRKTNVDLEAAHEELQSSSEELETTNEELQSTNEELETMNEELQSTNEELQAMNDELRQRGEELVEMSDFMSAILGSMRTGVVVLDRELLVRAWNKKMEELWGVRADEVEGKAFMTLDIGLPIDQLAHAIRGSLANGDEVERTLECTNRRGKAIRCRITVTPVKNDPNRGVTLVIEELAA